MAEEKYRCEECGEIFDSEVEWAQHNRKVHARYTCPNCLETFDEEQKFDAHNLNVHPEQQKSSR